MISIKPIKFFFLPVLLAFLVLLSVNVVKAQPGTMPAPVINDDTPAQSDTGYLTITWSGQENAYYEAEISDDPSFEEPRALYSGHLNHVFVSGLHNGDYYFRVRQIQESPPAVSPWSALHQLTVQHHDINQTFILLGLGALVFLITALFIILAAYNESKNKGQKL